MANPNDNLRRLYQNGLKHFSLPDFDTFQQDMKDEQKRRRFYTNMQQAYSLPDFDTFSTDIGAVGTVSPTPAQPTAQARPQQQTVTPAVQPIKDTSAQQATVGSGTTPAKPSGWTPSPMQKRAMLNQIDSTNAQMKKENEEIQKRMENIQKSHKSDAFMGERNLNPQTGQMERSYYTTQGDRVATPMQQSRANSAYHQWWENNTEAGQRSRAQRLQREEERREQAFETRLADLWRHHDPADGLNAAEQAWSAAESAYYSAGDRNRENTNQMVSSFAMNSSEAAAFKQMETVDNFTDRLTTHDLDALMDNAWNNLGEEGQKALIDDCYQMLRYRNPGIDGLVLYNHAKEFARQQSDLRMYNLAVEKNLPKSNLEYFLRKIGDMNLATNIGKGFAVNRVKKTGDMAAYEAANEQYRQDGHKILDMAGTVAGFALDPTTLLSAYVGGSAAKLAIWAGGRRAVGFAASKAVAQSAGREFAKTMTGRFAVGLASGSAGLGSFEGSKELENQFAHGGKVSTMDENGNLLREGRYVNEGYSASAVVGQTIHGLGMGAAIGWLGPVFGNVSDKLVRGGGKLFGKEMSGIRNVYGKTATRAGMYMGSTVLEGTIFSVPEWISGERDALDVWTDNMAMMVGFKAKHMIKSTGGVLGDLKASFESPTNGRKNRLDFESRLRMRMDAPSDGGLALTKDEAQELSRHGYGDLRELVESAQRTGDASKGSLITRNAPEIVSRLTDMVKDTRVSEAARAKMYYYATGRKLTESPIMRGVLLDDGNGGFIVESHGANGVITSRSFRNRKAADLELERINRQAELNTIEFGERYQQIADFENRMQDACRTVAEEKGWDMVDVYRICEGARRNHLRGGDKQFDEVQQNILRKVTDAMGEFEETDVTEAMRGRIYEEYGVDVDAAIRKDADRRSQEEQRAVEEYIDELIPDRVKANRVEDVTAEDISSQKQLSDNRRLLTASPNAPDNNNPAGPRRSAEDTTPRQPDDRDKPIGRAVMKYQDRQVEVLSGRVVMMDDGTMVDKNRSDASIVIRDMETGKVEMVAPESILSYEEYAAPAEEATAAQGEAAPESGEAPRPKYRSGQIKIRNSDGTETRGWLTGNVDKEGKYEYYVEGDVQNFHYSSEHELDNILSDYQPDAPQEQPAEGEQAQQPAERPMPEGVADVKAYDDGYSAGIEIARGYSDAELNDHITSLREDAMRLTDAGRGMLEAYEYEQQRRAMEAQPAPEAPSQPIVDTREYDRGYERGIEVSTSLADDVLNDAITDLRGRERLTDAGRGMLEAYEYEQQRRAQSVPKTAESVPNPTENGVSDVENAPEAVSSVENEQEEAPQSSDNPYQLVRDILTSKGVLADGQAVELIVNNTDDANDGGQITDLQAKVVRRRVQQALNKDNPTKTDIHDAIVNKNTSKTKVNVNGLSFLYELLDKYNNGEISSQEYLDVVESMLHLTEDAKNAPEHQAWVNRLTATTEQPAEGTALARIPLHEETGEPMFEAVDKETAWDGLVEAVGSDKDAADIAQAQIEQASNELESLKKKPPTLKAPKLKGSPMAMAKAKQEAQAKFDQEVADHNQQLADTQARLNSWLSILGVHTDLTSELRRQQEAEARRLAAERAEAEKAERAAREEAERLEREALEGVPEWHMDTPENARKRGTRRVSGQMFSRQEPVPSVVGNEVEVKFSQKDLPKGHVAVIEADQLQPSHIQGQRNPMFFIDEAQPKNRAEAVSMSAAKEMAEGIRPQEITGSATAYTGAPTVNTRGEVIQGNNRSDALRFLWGNNLPTQQQTYKQYLLDNAEQFGIDPEAVNAMQHPVLVNMLDVDDAEAIRLGQMTAQDTESGGIERIKPKNVAQKLGNDMRSFATQLLRSGDEEATFGQLVDRNGAEVLKWMAQKGAITDTQYQSAFDSKGNLTAEAKNDLQKVLYQAVFKGASPQLEEMFDKLPAKAQRAILSTAFRDMDSPFAGKMLPEIQSSIAAYNHLMSDPIFGAAKKMEEALRAVEDFKRSIQLDDRFEQYMPADNFSNFALHLAAMYKANDMSQSTIAGYFNQMYDLAQGKKAATLFEEADTTEYPLADVIKQVLNIDYKPAKNGNNNVANGGADVALRNQTGQGGELRGNEPPAGGEQNPAGTEPSERGAGTSDDSAAGGAVKADAEPEVQTPATVQSAVEAASAEVNTEPTPAQAEAGNYKKGHVTIGEFDITIENPAGSVRKGVDAAGKEWTTTMANAYGYIKGTEGADGDHIDVFLHRDMDDWNGRKVYVVDQTNRDGTFDEHKVMLGFNDKDEAMAAYLANYDKSWGETHPGLHISETNVEDFNRWVQSSDRKTKPFADYKSVRALIHDVDQTPTNVNEGGMVVDSEGKALTLYHGTPNEVELSDLEMGHTRAGGEEAARYNGDGISFTPNRDVAEDYASDNGGNGKVFEVNVTLKKPYFTLGVANLSPEEAAEFTASLQGKGYDGIINYQSKAMREAGAIPNEVIVFDIRSATPVKGASEKREKPWYGAESEMPATPGLKPRQRSAMYEASVEAFRDGQMAHNHLDVFGRSAEEFELPYDEFVSRYREIVTEGTATATEKYLPEVFEYLKNRFNTALDKATKGDPARAAATIEGDGYKVEPKPYTNKQGKTLDTYLVTFDRDFSKEELSALRANAKALKGGYERESKGWMFRSVDDAKAFAKEVADKSEDEVADEAPLSMADMEKSAPKSSAPAQPTGNPMKKVDVEGVFDALKTRGEAKLSDHATPIQYKDPLTEDVIATLAKWDMSPTHQLAESRLARHYAISYTRAGRILREIQEHSKPTADNTPKTTPAPSQESPKPKKRRWISDEDADEFNSLRDNLRNHFGKGDDIVKESGAEYGQPKPKQMDAEVLRMGTRMTYLMMKGGLRSFSDYCEAMKEELPDIFDEMRPHLKSLYAATQNMEEVMQLGWDEEMDDRKTVKAFDVYNFDKPGAKDIIATAQHTVDERASQQQTNQIIQTLKEKRNEQRKKEADETSADTEAIIDKAETTASQVESKLEDANSDEDAEGLSRSIDKEIEEVNKQLALLGYYEADPVDKDFNEAYGYMRNAERKAVQDAHRLATQLAADLGITIDPKDKVRKSKYGFGSKIARSNVAPAGGEVYITLPLTEGRELSIWLSLDKNEPWREGGREDRYDEDLMLTGIMYRVENTGKGGMDRYESSNHNTRPTVAYDELLSDIRRLVRSYLPDEQVKPATPLAPQPGEDIVDMAKRVAADKKPKTPDVEPQKTMVSLFGEELENFDNQGNPIDKNGHYIVEEVKSVSELSDDDFMSPTRNVVLPELQKRVSDAIGAEGRKPIIKRNIFGKNRNSHKDLTAEDGRKILNEVLYNPNLYGQNQKESRPYNWIMVHLSDKNSAVVLEVNPTKDYLEIVNWHYLNGRQLEQKKRQAEREGGRILTLQESNAAGDTSQGLSFESKDNDKFVNKKTNERTDVQSRSEEPGRGGQQPRPNEPLGAGAKHEDERTDGGRMAQRGGEHSVSDAGRGAGVSGQHKSGRGVSANLKRAEEEFRSRASGARTNSTGQWSERGVSASRTPDTPKNTRNNHAERGVDYAPKGEKARIDANLAAIELAKELLATGRAATPQEMAKLRRYSGWGGLGSAFNEGSAWAPNPMNKRLREALTPEEYQAAVMSRNSAYYTPAAVIDAMWDVAKALGFKGGNIVEGSAGIGNIIGLMPTDISERSNIHAVEIDPTTGGILSLLYPDAKVEVQGFEQTRIANGSVDLAITNVPFVTDLHVMDESGDSDLSKKFRDIHDFCIAKNVRKLREGGIGIFITSSGTLDKSQRLRNWLVSDKEGNADVVGVFRMNNQTFGGTAATSDIIVVRKRLNGRKSANAIDVSTVTPLRTATFTDARGKTKDLPLYVNRYFLEHPEHMGGEMFFGFEQGDTYRPTSIGLFPTRTADQSARMSAWVKHLADMDWRTEAVSHIPEQTSQINEALGEGVKEGSMVTDSEGNLCVARMGRAVPLELNKNKIKGRTKEECFKDYTEIKSALAEVLKYQTEHDDDAGLQPHLDRLNRAYDTFVQRYGNLNKNNNLAWLRNDVDFSSIVALETYSEKGTKDGTKVKTYGKTDIFNRRVVEKESEPSPKNVKDGIIASLYKFGRIDTDYLATQLGKSQDDVKQEIVDSGLGFVDPTTGQMEVSYEYLSGNVREKLRQAREANEAAGGGYDANIKALEAVVPMNIPAHLIEFALGSSWIEPQLYERYIKERTELDVKLTNAGGTWHMAEPWNTDKPKNTEMGVRSEAFGILIPGHKLIDAALTNKTITVSRTVKDSDGGSHTETDPAATTACATKVDEIRQDFKDWAREQMQNDPALSMRMEEKYNEKFNNSVPKSIPDEFVPEHFGGAATTVGGKPFRLRQHQAKAVIRATTQPVLLAHEVGTGKTYTLITTAMEMRRLGTARKPMIVVQNATVGQFVASAKTLYPNAKILTLEDADRNAEGRKAFYAKIKFNDWDMIVVPQSVFERIPDSIERQAQFIQDKIEEKMLVLEQMKDADPNGRSMIVRAAEREISRLEDEMTQLANGGPAPTGKKKDAKKAAITRQNAEVKARELLDRATDDVEDFDSMGIDAILVDEAHEYKHLGFATAMQRGVKGVDPSPSKKSQGVFLKAQAVLEKTGGKNVVFATGTPISNTAAEIWTFMRYLIPADVMKEYDIYYFDDFVRNFGNLQQMLEFKTNGRYDEVNRFAGYVNLPELVRIWSTVADTVLTREAAGVSDKIPALKGGKATDIYLPQTRALRSIMKFVKAELDRYAKMTGKEKKENSHIPLVMYGIAKAAAVDARLVQSDAEDDPNSKTNACVRHALNALKESEDYKGTVGIFADNYQNKHSGFNLYEDMRQKFIANGVPAEQIAIMKPGMTVKKKLEIFDKVNAGEIRVIMGSTYTLGTGVNIQERLAKVYHLDAPNRPMDYTQRNGRLLRQGNLHLEWGLPVEIVRFGVEDSLDVTAYQRLKTKGAIADSIMNGKQLMENSMENRSLEEDQDLFGDITAQLSGSEYAMLKNQIEKEVRKLRAAEKNWMADQTYIHNRKRQIAGQNKEAEERKADNKSYLEKVEAATIGDITVGKLSFPSVDAMEDFFTEQNKKKAAMQEQVRTSGYSSRPATSDITISVGGFDFKIHTEITKEMKHQQGDLFATAPAKMTYSCPELGIDAMPVRGNAIKNAVLDIMENIVSGKNFRERIENAERYIERNNAELESISKRDGIAFKDADALAKAEEKLEEYEGLMKAEMAAKEAKYAEMDKDVEAASNIALTEEESEATASEPVSEYSGENANFASRYETADGKSVRYTSESGESYGGLFDFDFSGEDGGSEAVNNRAGADKVQREGDSRLNRHDSRLNEEAGEFSVVERVFTESGSFKFTSGERIESAADVAYIFSALEDSAKEHSFVVLVKDGTPTVVELGMGTFTATMVDIPTASLAYNRIRPDQVYFVHNHPSGNLMCSPQDVQMLKKIGELSDVPVTGVIINLKTGKYGTFDTSNNTDVGEKRVPENEKALTVHTLDKQIFAADYDPMAQPLVRMPRDVAEFLNSHRMGDRAKVSFLIISRAGRIVGNIHTPFTEISSNPKEVARYISERVIQFGGESAILYGDFPISGSQGREYRRLKELLSQVGGNTLLDVVRVEGNHTTSANDEGLLFEPGSEYGASPEGDIRFREVEDDGVLREFAEGKTVKAYRTMQVIDGKLYSPMATKVGGKATPEIKLGVPEQAEEHPEIIKRTKVGRDGVEVGYVVIDKGLGKGTLEVAYNPSIHASRTALNDQFTSGHIRPNLVTVEVEIPLSELTSGYRAQFAKDAVGEISWHSGTVSGKLAELGRPRRVILSRYDRPVRIVPFREVAAMIADQLEGTEISIPYNVVQPQVRAELERLGVAISEEASGSVGKEADFGRAEYITDQEIERINARQREMAQTSPEAKRRHAEGMSKKFNTPIRIVNDLKELRSSDAARQARMRRSKGFYDPATGEVVVVVPNNATVEDMAETVFHEVVAHRGLREMIGDENYDAFCDEVYNHLKDDLKREVDEETTRRFVNEPGKGYEHHRRVAVDEMFGRMSEKGFEDFSKAERGVWGKLKVKVLEAINKFLGSLKLPKWVKLGDNELRYMLWRSHERLRSKGDYVDMARDAAKREELGLNHNGIIKQRKTSEEVTADKIEESFNAAVAGDLKGKPVEIGQLTKEGKAYLEELSGLKLKENVKFKLNPSDLVHIYKDHFGDNEKDPGQNTPLTKEDIRNIAEVLSHPDKVLFGVEKGGDKRKMFFFLKSDDATGAYNLLEIYANAWGNLTSKSFYRTKKSVSQRVLSLKKSEHLTSVTDGPTLNSGANLPKFFENQTISEEESVEYRFRDGETGDIWKDQSVGLEERITNAAIRLSNNQRGDLTLRNDAMRAIGGNLTSLRKAMAAQKRFDQATAKRVADLARILMQNGYLSGMTSGEMQRLLSAVKNSVGHKEVKESVEKVMEIMVDNQLRNGESTLRQLLSVRGSKVDARGVEVQGVLDVEGQRTMEVVKGAISLPEDDINERIAEALNRMSDPDRTIAEDAALEYAGLHMALEYVQNIAGSKAEEQMLRESLKRAKEEFRSQASGAQTNSTGQWTDESYRQFVETTEDAIRKNKIERAEAYFNLAGRLSDSLRGSIENAKAFREAEKARVNEIHHNANSDMEGRPTNEHHKDDWKDKFVNNSLVQFLFAPLATFDQILRVFGNKSANGEGYLWNRFMRGWVDCRNKELTGVKEKFARLDEKAAELFGKRQLAGKDLWVDRTWGDLIRMEGKLPKGTVSFWDGGEMRDHELTQGNLLYIYMVDKMTDGRMKLRRMGITEDDIADIESVLDPRFKALGDWLQDEFLVDTRNEYNETHKRMFGASMAAIENYFPLKILANARVDKEEDVNQQNVPDGITTKTGSIIKRRVNNLALDITGADALSVILDHITQMEHWNAYAEWNRDLNTLRTYKRFRNQVINMTTVYGGGRRLWKKFNDLSLMGAGEYRPPVSDLNKSAVNLAKGVTAAKVSFRMYTALKQFLSAPAYAPEVSMRAIAKSIVNPYGDFKWCLENMPIFRERWHSRISGDPRLLKSDMDWKMWRSRVMEISSRIGMTPNAFVDAVTVSIGARAMYETRLKQYLKEGYPTDAAEKRAMQDATILFNQTQQSSESPFLSTMQVDKDWLSTLFTAFRNSSMSYTRQTYDGARNLKRNLTPGQRAKSIEFMTKQILRDWNIDPDAATDAERGKAEEAARSRFKRQIKKDVIRIATFGYVLEWLWNLGPYLPYIIFGYYISEKDKMWDDVFTHSNFGSVEGLTGGDVMSSFGNMAVSGEWNRNQLSKDMPLASDINSIYDKYIGGKNAEAINDILNLVVQMGVGMNPQSITDAAIAITDACGDDPALSHEAAIFVMRVLQVPQSQLEKLYFDEIDMSGEEASKLTPEQLAQRYAEYKVKRGTPLAPWTWGDEERLGKYNALAKERMKERLDAQGDAEVIEAYADFEARYKAVSNQAEKAKELMKTDYAAAAQAHAELQQNPDFVIYQQFGSLDKQLTRLSKMWLKSKTPEEASLIATTISSYRAGMVKALQAETAEAQQSAMAELATLMSDFYGKYQGMQPQGMQPNR